MCPHAAPTAPPSRPETVSYSSNSISLTWESPPAEHVNGVLRHYTVVYLEQDTSLEFSATSNTTSLQLMDLHPHFTYVMRVRAETVSPGPFSDTQSVQLQEDGMLGHKKYYIDKKLHNYPLCHCLLLQLLLPAC